MAVALLSVFLFTGAEATQAVAQNGVMTEEEASKLGEEFGIVVGAVDEAIQKELNERIRSLRAGIRILGTLTALQKQMGKPKEES